MPARAEGASRTGLSPSAARLSRRSRSRPPPPVQVPQPPGAGPRVWAWSAFARRYLRNRSFFLFLRLLRCFTSPGLAPAALFGSRGGGILEDAGLPHSETPGSKTACVSPGLIAACRVLLRLPPPRHPPCARTVWTPNSRAPVGPHGPRGDGMGAAAGMSWQAAHKKARPVSLMVCCFLWKKSSPTAARCRMGGRRPVAKETRRGGKDAPALKSARRTARTECCGWRVWWWAHMDSDHGPRPYQRRALTN